MRSYRDSADGGLFQFQGAWGTVLAPPGWADTVRDVIAEVRQSSHPARGPRRAVIRARVVGAAAAGRCGPAATWPTRTAREEIG